MQKVYPASLPVQSKSWSEKIWMFFSYFPPPLSIKKAISKNKSSGSENIRIHTNIFIVMCCCEWLYGCLECGWLLSFRSCLWLLSIVDGCQVFCIVANFCECLLTVVLIVVNCCVKLLSVVNGC